MEKTGLVHWMHVEAPDGHEFKESCVFEGPFVVRPKINGDPVRVRARATMIITPPTKVASHEYRIQYFSTKKTGQRFGWGWYITRITNTVGRGASPGDTIFTLDREPRPADIEDADVEEIYA